MSDALDRRYDGMTAMVVDDDYDLLDTLRVRLEKVGFKVVTAESQAGGEELIRDVDADLAIFDLMMENPDSGFVLSHRLKVKSPDVPVILVTGVARETGMKFDAGTDEMRRWVKADVVMDKGIRWEQLGREIARLIKE